MLVVKLDGKKCADVVHQSCKDRVQQLNEQGIQPKLVVILVGDDKASQVYVRNKQRVAEKIGLTSETILLPADTTEEVLLEQIESLNQADDCHGILLQFPLPAHIDGNRCLAAIDPNKDVDGFHPFNVGKLAIGEEGMKPCTPLGIIHLLHAYDISIAGKHAVIVGRSNIVGKPMAQLLLAENATVTVCHSQTENLAQITKQADILIVATGKSEWITKDYVQTGAVVIDVGMNRVDGKLTGDVDKAVAEVASFMTPVPGGVGPMTIAMLMQQTIQAAERQVGYDRKDANSECAHELY